jgi:hypothetical protein
VSAAVGAAVATEPTQTRGLVLIDCAELGRKRGGLSAKSVRRRLGLIEGRTPHPDWAWLLERDVLFVVDGEELFDLAAVDRGMRRHWR